MPPSPQLRPSLSCPLRLFRPHLPPSSRVRKPPFLVLGHRNHTRNWNRLPLPVHRNVRHVRRRNMPQGLSARVLHHGPNSNLHAGAERPVYARLQNQQVAHMHRRHKVRWSIEADTTIARECRTAATAPTRSINCISRPPNRFPSAFESAGKIISLRSACDSATVRDTTLSSLIPSF